MKHFFFIELDSQNMILRSNFKTRHEELEQKEWDLKNKRLIFEEEMKEKKQG